MKRKFVLPEARLLFFHHVHEGLLKTKIDEMREHEDKMNGVVFHYGDNSRAALQEQHDRDSRTMFDFEVENNVELDTLTTPNIAHEEITCDGYFLTRANIEQPRNEVEVPVIILEREMRRFELMESLGFDTIRNLLVNKQLEKNEYYTIASLRVRNDVVTSDAFSKYVFDGDVLFGYDPSDPGFESADDDSQRSTTRNVELECEIGPVQITDR